MSFDDWDRYLKQKYYLAVAIAVIKNRPENQTNEAYIQELRNKIQSRSEMEFEDFNVSVCSEDFNIDDESSTQNDQTLTDTQAPVRETNCSPTILENFDFEENIQNHFISKTDSLSDTLSLLKAIDRPGCSGLQKNMETPLYTENVFQDLTQSTYHDCHQDHNYAGELLNERPKPASEDIKNSHKDIKSKANNNQKDIIDSQETETYTLTFYDTHVSQSQIIDHRFDIQDKYINGARKRKNEDDSKTVVKQKQKQTNVEPKFIHNVNSSTFIDISPESNTKNIESKQNYTNIDSGFIIYNTNSCDGIDVVHKNAEIKQKFNNINSAPTHNNESYTILDDNDIIPHTNNKDSLNDNDLIRHTETNKNASNTQNVSDEEFNSQTDNVIPFKIIEELNRVKASFKRKRRMSNDSVSTDSGFLSDSQIKSTFRSGLQSQGNINQSAYCLFNYIMHCPIMSNTLEITNEISEVLGELIDKLHAEELYPPFLDEILDYIKTLLDDIIIGEDGRDSENTPQNKDERTHRLLLLNKSLHITTYTIEKIAAILEEFHSKLTAQNLYETSDISKTENICYLFHALELLLQRYSKKRNILSSLPTSQKSEDEGLPKKSCITDIWRKKWDPDYKRKSMIETSFEPKSLSSKIGDVLNRLVVDCMDGYSLISFAALQCFNLIQS